VWVGQGDDLTTLDLATRRVASVPLAIDEADIAGGVSTSSDGVVAFLSEAPTVDDAVVVRTVGPDGQPRSTFRHEVDRSFPVSGARISPDGRRVAYALNVGTSAGAVRRTYVSNVDGTERFFFDVTAPDVVTTATPSAAVPAWLPDGRLLVTTASGFLLSDAALERLTRVGPTTLANPDHPVVSPDGRTVVFDQERGASAADPASTSRAVWALDLTTGAVRPLVRSLIDVYAAGISPDGRYLVLRDSAPFSAPGVGAFRRWYLLVVPFPAAPVDVSDREGVVLRDARGDQFQLFGMAGWY
jgi:dipeptidyl aminopeptidase/acylaminoacyl peptidase